MARKNKTRKNKTRSKCLEFCKNEYSKEYHSKTNNIITVLLKKPYHTKLAPRHIKRYTKICKPIFCNKNCSGYRKHSSKKKKQIFKKSVNNSFSDEYSPEQIQELKKHGAISGCVYDRMYNVFHS
jgi:hypothetical protein